MSKFIDIHSHVLPAVDDGCVQADEALAILRDMESHGVSDLFLTPHYCKRRDFVCTPDDARTAYELLKEKARQAGLGICLHLGTEMEYSQDGARYIKEGRVSTLAGTKYILVEFPPGISVDSFMHRIREIFTLGLVPVVAHIERYVNIVRTPYCVTVLKNMGALVQVNIRSVSKFNFRLRRFLKTIFANRQADFLAGDVHACPIEKKEFEKCKKFVVKHTDEEYFNALVYTNAKKYLLR